MINAYFKNILIPTDFSDAAENAVTHGLELASKTNSTVKLLFTHYQTLILDGDGQFISDDNESREITRANEKKLSDWQKRAYSLHPDLRIECINKGGYLTDVIQSICEEEKIDLIVMGTKGASGINEYVVGTNTVSVLENVKCPVLVVPGKAFVKPYKKILYATDFQLDDLEALIKLVSLADLFTAHIEVVHVSDHPEKEADKMKWFQKLCEERAPNKNITFNNAEESHSTIETLNNLIVSDKIDLVVMNSTGKSFLKKLFSGSLTEKMAYHTDIPFLAFHVKKDNRL